ncbi:MAG: glycosyltransferase [Cyanobacterium sp. T60_A2020_053]|nr:glycosyltransferase [Cyanobacterium sp. T60_A2020_053]
MKVAHIIPSIAPVRGGPSKAIIEMVDALQNKGVCVEIITTNDNGNNLLNVPLYRQTVYEKVPVTFFPRLCLSSKAIQEFNFAWSLTKWLWGHISDYDLIHVHTLFNYPSTIAMVIAKWRKIPYIIRPCGMLLKWSLQQKATKKELYLKLIEEANINYSQRIHYTALQEKEEAQVLNLKTKDFILPLGLTIPELIPRSKEKLINLYDIPKNIPIILFLSRIHEKKGLDFLVNALGKLSLDFRLIIAGSGEPDYEDKIKNLITSNNLKNKVIWAGFVEGELKNTLLQGSDLFALTSYSENFGIAVLEALASGLPVVITPGIALSSMVKDNDLGYICDLDIDSIYLAITRALSNPEKLEDMSRRGRKFIQKNYSWDKIAKDLVDVYKEIIKDK